MMGGALCLGGTAFATCQGTRGCDRRTGPAYEQETASWVAAIRAMAGPGMWLVVRGYHLGDDIIAILSNSPLSHASVLDVERWQAIEAVGKGVVGTAVDRFLRGSHRLQIVEPRGWTAARGAAAVARARGAVGKGYDYLGIVGAPSTEHFYCSELALWSMGIAVDRPGPNHVIHPRHLDRYGRVLFDSRDRDGAPDFRTS